MTTKFYTWVEGSGRKTPDHPKAPNHIPLDAEDVPDALKERIKSLNDSGYTPAELEEVLGLDQKVISEILGTEFSMVT